jgi:hypothetical protein
MSFSSLISKFRTGTSVLNYLLPSGPINSDTVKVLGSIQLLEFRTLIFCRVLDTPSLLYSPGITEIVYVGVTSVTEII